MYAEWKFLEGECHRFIESARNMASWLMFVSNHRLESGTARFPRDAAPAALLSNIDDNMIDSHFPYHDTCYTNLNLISLTIMISIDVV